MTKTVTYIEHLRPGSLFADWSASRVDERDPAKHASEAGAEVYAFRYYDVHEADSDGITLRSQAMNHSSYYYIDAQELSVADVQAMNDNGQYDILLRNMVGSGWDSILRCRTGNFCPKENGDVVITL